MNFKGNFLPGAAPVAGLIAAAALIVLAPAASAVPVDCSQQSIQGTVGSVTSVAGDYLAAHPGANQVVMAAYGQSPNDAAASIRSYFTTNPSEYNDLRGILAPIGETQRQCNVPVLPPALASAYSQFMAG